VKPQKRANVREFISYAYIYAVSDRIQLRYPETKVIEKYVTEIKMSIASAGRWLKITPIPRGPID